MVVASEISVKPRAKMTKSNKNNKLDKSLLIVAQELKIARILAGNNKAQRDRTLKKLKKWFDAREAQMPFTEDDFMRIWKGLFYYMWMSDKPLIQEECAENISKLANFNNTETSLLFYKCFLKTMINEWFGIDSLRLDKFLMLVRRVLRQAFRVLDAAEWNSENVTEFQNILNETVLNLENNVPLSLSMHMAEIYLEELAKVSNGEISEETVLELTKPFALQVAFTRDGRLNNHIKQYVFRYLLNQSDPGIEYQLKFDAWRQLGFPGGTIDAMEKIDKDSDNENDEEMPEIDSENKPLDPRAGKVHVDLPQLKFDSIKMAQMLDELKLDPKTTTKTRKQLNNTAQQFRVLATGKYPFGLNKVELKPKSDGYSTKVKSSLKRLQRFEQKLLNENQLSSKAKNKKQRNKKIKEIIRNELEKYKNIDFDTDKNLDSEENGESETLEDFISKSEEGLFENPLLKNNKKATPTTQVPELKKSKKRKLSELKNSNSKKIIQRNSGVWEIDDLEENSNADDDVFIDNNSTETKTKKPKKIKKTDNKLEKKTKKFKTESNGFDISSLDNELLEETNSKKSKKEKKPFKKQKIEDSNNFETELDTDQILTSQKLKSKKKKSTEGPNEPLIKKSPKKINGSSESSYLDEVFIENSSPNVKKSPKNSPKTKKLKKGSETEVNQVNGDDSSYLDEVFIQNSSPNPKKSPKSKKSSPKKNLKGDSETEITLKVNGNDIFSTPKGLRQKENMSTPKAFVKNPFSTPVSSAKKVKIALNLNRSQEHSEYHQSLVSSPGIPFDADKKPSKPLLKTRMSLPSAINPFYKRKF